MTNTKEADKDKSGMPSVGGEAFRAEWEEAIRAGYVVNGKVVADKVPMAKVNPWGIRADDR